MKPINLNTNFDKLNPAIDEVQKLARTRKISADTVTKVLKDVERQLDITKKAMDGITVYADPCSQKFPNAYARKGSPYSTQFRAIYKNGSWRVIDISRDYCWGTDRTVRIVLTEAAKKAVIDRVSVI